MKLVSVSLLLLITHVAYIKVKLVSVSLLLLIMDVAYIKVKYTSLLSKNDAHMSLFCYNCVVHVHVHVPFDIIMWLLWR